MIRLPKLSLLATAVGIVVGEKRLLICETPKGHLELPGFLIAKAEKAIAHLNKFLSQLGLSELPQQTLYLPQVALTPDTKNKITAVIRILRFPKKRELKLPNCHYEYLEQLLTDDQATALTKAVAGWISTAD